MWKNLGKKKKIIWKVQRTDLEAPTEFEAYALHSK